MSRNVRWSRSPVTSGIGFSLPGVQQLSVLVSGSTKNQLGPSLGAGWLAGWLWQSSANLEPPSSCALPLKEISSSVVLSSLFRIVVWGWSARSKFLLNVAVFFQSWSRWLQLVISRKLSLLPEDRFFGVGRTLQELHFFGCFLLGRCLLPGGEEKRVLKLLQQWRLTDQVDYHVRSSLRAGSKRWMRSCSWGRPRSRSCHRSTAWDQIISTMQDNWGGIRNQAIMMQRWIITCKLLAPTSLRDPNFWCPDRRFIASVKVEITRDLLLHPPPRARSFMKFATLGPEFARVQKLRGLVLGGNLNWSRNFAYNPSPGSAVEFAKSVNISRLIICRLQLWCVLCCSSWSACAQMLGGRWASISLQQSTMPSSWATQLSSWRIWVGQWAPPASSEAASSPSTTTVCWAVFTRLAASATFVTVILRATSMVRVCTEQLGLCSTSTWVLQTSEPSFSLVKLSRYPVSFLPSFPSLPFLHRSPSTSSVALKTQSHLLLGFASNSGVIP